MSDQYADETLTNLLEQRFQQLRNKSDAELISEALLSSNPLVHEIAERFQILVDEASNQSKT